MAGDWIKVRRSLARDGRLRIMSRSLRDTCHASVTEVFGALVTLWCIADEHADENGEIFGWTCEDIDHEINLPGFCEALPDCWIDVSGEWVKLPDYQEHNTSTGKSRSQAQKRKKIQRENDKNESRSKRDKGHAETVTREEKRRVLNNSYWADNDIKEIWVAFKRMRRSIKAPVNETAEKRLIAKLKNLQAADNDPAEVLNRSIENCWKGVFPLKDKNHESTSRKTSNGSGNRTVSTPASRGKEAIKRSKASGHGEPVAKDVGTVR